MYRKRTHSQIIVALAALALTPACWAPPHRVEPSPLEIVRVDPQVAVALDAAITVELTAPVSLPVDPGALTATAGGGVPIELGVHAEGLRLVVRPQPFWPASSSIRVSIDGLRASDGRKWPAASFGFETQASSRAPMYVVEAPSPGTAAPTNLATLILAVHGAVAPESVTLVRADERIVFSVVAREDTGRFVARRAEGGRGLASEATYAVELPEGWRSLVEGAVSVRTGTLADTVAPQLRLRGVWRGGEAVRATVEADEPILGRGTLIGPDGVESALDAPLASGRRLELDARGRLQAGARYILRLAASDLAGNEAAPLEVELVMPEAVRVQLTEVVPTPLHDWGSEGEGIALDARPGTGAVTDTDEWIEVVNVSDSAVDLTQVDLRVRVSDTTPVEHALAASAQLYFGRGGELTRWGVGEPLVLRPRGSMAQRDVTIEIIWGDQVLDRLSLGRVAGADHAGGTPPDLDHEAIARDGEVWRWCRPSPGELWAVACVR
jgi:hypothetical protein